MLLFQHKHNTGIEKHEKTLLSAIFQFWDAKKNKASLILLYKWGVTKYIVSDFNDTGG